MDARFTSVIEKAVGAWTRLQQERAAQAQLQKTKKDAKTAWEILDKSGPKVPLGILEAFFAAQFSWAQALHDSTSLMHGRNREAILSLLETAQHLDTSDGRNAATKWLGWQATKAKVLASDYTKLNRRTPPEVVTQSRASQSAIDRLSHF